MQFNWHKTRLFDYFKYYKLYAIIIHTQPAPQQDVICVIDKIIELYATNMIRSVTEF